MELESPGWLWQRRAGCRRFFDGPGYKKPFFLSEEGADCQKTQESSRGPQPFRPGSARLHLLPLFHKKGSANIQRGHGTVFASENPIFQRKKRFLAGSAPEKSSIFSGDWRGWQWRGSLLPRPPACQNFFDKLNAISFRKSLPCRPAGLWVGCGEARAFSTPSPASRPAAAVPPRGAFLLEEDWGSESLAWG